MNDLLYPPFTSASAGKRVMLAIEAINYSGSQPNA